MTRPAKKKIMAEAYFRKSAELKATLDRAKKEPLSMWFKERINDMSKNVEPIQAIAVVGMTLIIHDIIISTDQFVQSVARLPTLNPQILVPITGKMGPVNPPAGSYSWVVQKPAGAGARTGETTTIKSDIPQDSLTFWAVSLAIAYIVVTQAGALMGLMSAGLQTIIPLFLLA